MTLWTENDYILYDSQLNMQVKRSETDYKVLPEVNIPVGFILNRDIRLEEIKEIPYQRHNEGKPDLSFLDPLAVEMVVSVFESGSKKYPRNNWKLMKPQELQSKGIASLLRHVLGYKDKDGDLRGIMNKEYLDKESGLSNLSHIMACAMIIENCIRVHGWEEVKKYL